MPKAFRLYPPHAPGDPLSGEGARLYGGRWNRPGTAIVYTSEHLSLAVLEVLVNNVNREKLRDYHFLELEFDAKLIDSIKDPLPKGWLDYPAPGASQDTGTHWAEALISAVLAVPSAIVPIERNYILNPRHPDFKRIKVSGPFPFAFDARLKSVKGS